MKKRILKYLKKYALIIFLLGLVIPTQAQDTDDLKEQANALFEEEKYEEAKGLYSQLTSFYPRDPFYNYRLGACMLIVDSDKGTPLKYLEYAVTKLGVNNEAFYYLGLAYHYNYQFNNAGVYYLKFKDNATNKELKKFPVERQLRMCQNGKTLLKNINDLNLQEKKQLNTSNFYISYKVEQGGGRILKIPNDLKTTEDEKREYQGVMHRADSGYIYYSSYGEKGDFEKDIYRITLSENGELGTPERLPDAINTIYDEEFPFLHPNGHDLYFASKGHNSMGGYDIFITTYDSTTGQWSKPRNLDFAVNTPDDDILYVENPEKQEVYFASTRNCAEGKINLYKVSALDQPIKMNILSGVFSADQTKTATITVEDMGTGETIGKYTTNRESGGYFMRLPNGGKFRFLVEMAGSGVTHSGIVETPMLKQLRPLKQEMQIVVEGGKERLVIKNLFEEEELTEADRLLIAQELKRKSNLGAEEEGEEGAINKEDLVDEIEKEATQREEVASQLLAKAANTLQLAQQKSKLAEDELVLAQQMEATVSNFKNPTPQDQAKLEEINSLKNEARTHSKEAQAALQLVDELKALSVQNENDAQVLNELLQKAPTVEGEQLSMEYAALEISPVGEGDTPTDQAYNSLKEKVTSKRAAADKANRKAESLIAEEKEIKDDIAYYKQQASYTKDKQLKKTFETEVTSLEEELETNKIKAENQLAEAVQLEQEAKMLEQQLVYMEDLKEESSTTVSTSVSLQELNETAIKEEVNNTAVKVAELNIPDTEPVTASIAPTESEQNSETSSNEDKTENITASEPEVEATNGEEVAQNIAKSESTSGGIVAQEQEEASQSEPENEVETTSTPSVDAKTPTDYKSDLAVAETIADPYERENLKREVNQEWLADVNKEIAYLRNELEYNPNVEDRTTKEAQLQKLEQQAEDLRLDIMVSERVMADNAPASNKEILDTALQYTAVQDIEDRYFFDYESAYQKENEEERLAAENEINDQYVADLETRINTIDQQIAEGATENTASLEKEKVAVQALVKAKKARTVENQRIIDELTSEETTFVYKGEQENTTQSTEENSVSSVSTTESETTVAEQPQQNELNAYYQDKIDSIQGEIDALNVAYEQTKKKKERTKIEGQITELQSDIDLMQEIQASNAAAEEVAETTEQQPEISENESSETNTSNENEAVSPSDFIENEPVSETTTKTQTESDSIQFVIDELEAEQLFADEARKDSLANEIAALNAKLSENNALESTESEPTLESTPIEETTEQEVAEVTTPILSDNTNEEQEQTETRVIEAPNTLESEIAPNVFVEEEITSIKDPIEAYREGIRAEKEAKATQVRIDALQEEYITLNDAEERDAKEEEIEALYAVQAMKEAKSRRLFARADELGYEEGMYDPEQEELELEVAEVTIPRSQQNTIQEDAIESEIAPSQPEIVEQTESSVNPSEGEGNTLVENQAEGEETTETIAENPTHEEQTIEEPSTSSVTENELVEEATDSANEREAAALVEQAAASTPAEAKEAKEKADQLKQQIDTIDIELSELQIVWNNTKKKKKKAEIEDEIAQKEALKERIIAQADVYYQRAELLEQQQAYQQGETTEDPVPQVQASIETKDAEINALTNTLDNLQAELDETKKRKKQLPIQLEIAEKEDQLQTKLWERKQLNATLALLENNVEAPTELAETTSESKTNSQQPEITAVENEVIEQQEATPSYADASVYYEVPEKVEGEIFVKDNQQQSVYTEEKPIPINQKLPEGLVYKVQIGAFRNPIPQETFKGFAPITGETTASGLTRYTAGYFEAFANANTAKTEIRTLGYSDAFVVAYLNGERISIAQARSIENGAFAQTNTNQPTATGNPSTNQNATIGSGTVTPSNTPSSTVESIPIDLNAGSPGEIVAVSERGELFFTVQIGVFAESIDPSNVFKISPINSDRTANGLVRYSTGVYSNLDAASLARIEVVNTGISDAFVTAYYKGKRISVSEAKRLLESGEVSIASTPIVSEPASTSEVHAVSTENVPESVDVPLGQIAYKVEVGPYYNEVPIAEAAVLLNYSKFGVTLRKQSNQTVYQVGEYTNFEDAEQLKNNINSAGINSARVIKLRDGLIVE